MGRIANKFKTTTPHISLSLKDFPKVPQDAFISIPAQKELVGRCANDLFYNRNAQYVFTSIRDGAGGLRKSLRGVPGKNMIIDFYFWDERLDKYRDAYKYVELLDMCKAQGINMAVGMDYSIWFDMPSPFFFYNLYLNFSRLHMAATHGYKVVADSGIFLHEFPEIYDLCLPKNIPTICLDLGHEQKREDVKLCCRYYERAMETKNFKTAMMFTSKRDLSGQFEIFKLFKDHGIEYIVLPTVAALMTKVKSEQTRVGKAKKVIATGENRA